MAYETEFTENLIEILNYLMKKDRETERNVLRRLKDSELFPFRSLHSTFVTSKRRYRTNLLIIDKLLPNYDNITFEKIELQLIPTKEEMKTLPEVPITWKISEGDKAYNSKQIFVINVWAVKDETRSVYEPSTKVTEILITFPILWLGIYGSVGPIILKGGHLDELYFDGWIRPISTEEVTVDMITIYTKHAKNEFWLEPEELTFFATFVKKSKVKKIFFKCFYLDEDNLRENFVKAMGEEVMVDFSC